VAHATGKLCEVRVQWQRENVALKDDDGERSEALAVERGYWSAKAISLFNTDHAIPPVPNRELSLYSPDHSKQILVHNQKVSIIVGKREFPTDF
jgi:hypothetical protein